MCMGNICRSPTAHGVMQHKIDQAGLQNLIEIDSAGTDAFHVGEQSDPRSRALARRKGIDMEFIRARKINIHDYDQFDYILAMDDDNLRLIERFAPENHYAELALFLTFAAREGVTHETVVADPYYGGDNGFENVFSLVDTGCAALIRHIQNA